MIDVNHPEYVGSTAQADVRLDLSVKAEAGAGADNTSMAELAARSLARKYTAEAVLTVPTPVPPGVLVPRGMAVARTSMNPCGRSCSLNRLTPPSWCARTHGPRRSRCTPQTSPT